tara:strand:- start:845 stop:1147 length:303 start_codon:yes stop_codon:yes gene_type:complete
MFHVHHILFLYLISFVIGLAPRVPPTEAHHFRAESEHGNRDGNTNRVPRSAWTATNSAAAASREREHDPALLARCVQFFAEQKSISCNMTELCTDFTPIF